MSEELRLRAEPAVEQVHRAAAPSIARRRLRDELDRLTTVRAVLESEALDQETEAESVGELSSIDQHLGPVGVAGRAAPCGPDRGAPGGPDDEP